MDDEKRKALEAAGWKFGDAEDFLNEGGVMDADKMRAEFEKWASIYGFDLRRMNEGYFCRETGGEWLTWKYAYAAGRKAEREEMRLKNWDGIRLGTTDKPEGKR